MELLYFFFKGEGSKEHLFLPKKYPKYLVTVWRLHEMLTYLESSWKPQY